MTDWSKLSHAYGSAEDIPELLAELSSDEAMNEGADVWGELWGRVCHQGSVYDSSLRVLPYLFEAASKWEPKYRLMPIGLASSIVASALHEFPNDLPTYRDVIEGLYLLTLETFRPGCKENDFIYLLEAVLAFKGERFWSRRLNGLCEGEFEGECIACKGYLPFAIGEHGFFVTTELWTEPLKVTRYPLLACSVEELPEEGTWLFEQCKKYGYEELAHWFRYLFGQVVCPHCSENISVAEAITNGY
jgi:hypothetical protein